MGSGFDWASGYAAYHGCSAVVADGGTWAAMVKQVDW